MINVEESETGKNVTATKASWYFHGPAGSSKKDTQEWWRERRFRYNRDLFFVGVGSWLLVLFAGSAAVKPGVDFAEPIGMLIGPPFYALLANLAYTAGPTLDAVLFRGGPRKRLLKAGYVFSVALTALPGVSALTAWLWTLATGTKLD